jgi:hypothetical protein
MADRTPKERLITSHSVYNDRALEREQRNGVRTRLGYVRNFSAHNQVRHCWFCVVLLEVAHPAFVARFAHNPSGKIDSWAAPFVYNFVILISLAESETFTLEQGAHPIAPEMFCGEFGSCRTEGALFACGHRIYR